MPVVFRSILDHEQGKLQKAQRKVFARYVDSATPPVDYAAQSRALDDYLGETPEQPPVAPPRPPTFFEQRQQQERAGLVRGQAQAAFTEAARRGAPATRPFTLAEDVVKPVTEQYQAGIEGVPLGEDLYGMLQREGVVGTGKRLFTLATAPFAAFKAPAEVGGGVLSAAGVNIEPGRNLAREVGIQPSDDVGTILGKLRDYQATRPGSERFITENLALLALDPAFKGVAEAARIIGRGAGPAARATGRTLGEIAASEAGGIGKRAASEINAQRKRLTSAFEEMRSARETAAKARGTPQEAEALRLFDEKNALYDTVWQESKAIGDARIAADAMTRIEKGDFISLGGELGKSIRAPRGFVIGEGTLGTKNIPAWRIKGSNGKITAIPKDDARLISKSEDAFKRNAAASAAKPPAARVAQGQAELPATVKQPWEMTRAEFAPKARRPVSMMLPGSRLDKLAQRNLMAEQSRHYTADLVYHRRQVEAALAEGKPVPANVLADYPALAAKASPAPQPTTPAVAPSPPAAAAERAVTPPAAPAATPLAPWTPQAIGRLTKGDIVQLRPAGSASDMPKAFEVVGIRGRQIEVRDIQGVKQRISANTPVMRIGGSWKEVQDAAIQRYSPKEVTPKQLGGEAKQPVNVGDRVLHPNGTPLTVVDATDSALLTVKTPTGGTMKIGRAAVTKAEAPVAPTETTSALPKPASVEQAIPNAAPATAPSAAPAPAQAVPPAQTPPAATAGLPPTGAPPRGPTPPTGAVPPTQATQAAPVGPSPTGFKVPQVPMAAETLADLEARHPERLRVSPGTEAEAVKRGAALGAQEAVNDAWRLKLQASEIGDNAVDPIMAHLRSIGDPVKLFGIDDVGHATNVGNPNNLSLAWGDIFERPARYTLTAEQTAYVKQAQAMFKGLLEEAARHGVKITQRVSLDALWSYVARKVIESGPPAGRATVGVSRLGAKASFQKGRVFDWMDDGIQELAQSGRKYANPEETFTAAIKGYYKLIGDKQGLDVLKPLTRATRGPLDVPLDYPGFRRYWDTGRGQATRTRYIDKPTADAIAKAFEPEEVNAALRLAADVSRAGRASVATGDMSWPFLQGMPVLGHDLKNLIAAGLGRGKPTADWARSMADGVKAFADVRTIEKFRRDNYTAYLDAVKDGVMASGSEFFEGVGPLETAAGKLPVVGRGLAFGIRQLYGRANAAWTTASEEARILMHKGMKQAWVSDGAAPQELGEFVNKISGVTSSKLLGVGTNQRNLEAAFGPFASQYLRAQLMVMRDVFTRGTRSAAEARETLAATAAGLTAAYVASALALGQEPKLNPLPKRYGGNGGDVMTLDIGGYRVGPTVPYFWMLKTLAEVTAMAADAPDQLIKLNERHPLARAALNKASWLDGIAKEIITGKDFLGRDIARKGYELQDWALNIVTNSIPLAAGGAIEEGVSAQGLATGVLGGRSYPIALEDRISKLRFGEDSIRDLEPAQRSSILNDVGLLDKLLAQKQTSENRVSLEARRESLLAKEKRNALLDKGEMTWEEWERARSNQEADEAVSKEARALLLDRKPTKPRDANDTALAGYYDGMDVFRDKVKGFDSDGWRDFEQEYLAGLSPEQRRYVERNVHPNATVKERAYLAARKNAGQYWEIGKEIAKEKGVGDIYKEYLRTPSNQQTALKLQEPKLKATLKVIDAAREKLRRENAEIDLFFAATKGYKLLNQSNLNAARAGKLTFAGVPVAYTPKPSTIPPPLPTPAPARPANPVFSRP